MAATTVHVTTGDTQPLLTMALFADADCTVPLDLTDADSVDWRIGTSATKTATIDADPTTGLTHWQWDGDATLLPGWTYDVHAVVHYNDNSIETTKGDDAPMRIHVHAAA